ncbi:hypothetical protein L1887_11163 [Cichorium endivia]|nr:hypothetical protein L1887_11163 [Cichorium endivia]
MAMTTPFERQRTMTSLYSDMSSRSYVLGFLPRVGDGVSLRLVGVVAGKGAAGKGAAGQGFFYSVIKQKLINTEKEKRYNTPLSQFAQREKDKRGNTPCTEIIFYYATMM